MDIGEGIPLGFHRSFKGRVMTFTLRTALLLLFALQAPTPAPKLTGFAVQGTTVNIENFKGKQNVLVVFYRTYNWGYCKAQLGELQTNYQKIKDSGTQVVAVTADPIADAQKAAVEMNLAYPILADPSRTAITTWGVLHPTEGIARPSMFLVNKEGKIVWKYIGTDAADRPPIATVLKQLQTAK
jgi:thioredoxin-dependent peroxiredoxin